MLSGIIKESLYAFSFAQINFDLLCLKGTVKIVIKHITIVIQGVQEMETVILLSSLDIGMVLGHCMCHRDLKEHIRYY